MQNSSGALALTKSGTGTIVLSGTNTYAGLTTISAGTLQVGAAGSTGTLGSGNVSDNAA
ncbi:autotransporter-associated beta strand repeat-containing protein, partial [Roseateles saccharophilus]|uniref:autotransporter-associated beta strand repeat-containing protein n=1 Tax=Roseateles saccharophilus TaxID=304 RepID=UPI0039F14BA3